MISFVWTHISNGQTVAHPKIVEAAKKEAEVVWYTTLTLDMSKEVMDRFNKKYPFIRPTLYRSPGGPLLNRMLTEARAGQHAWDVAVGPGLMVVPLGERKLLGRYRSPGEKMVYEDLVDRDGYWASFYVLSFVLGYNTKLVKKQRDHHAEREGQKERAGNLFSRSRRVSHADR